MILENNGVELAGLEDEALIANLISLGWKRLSDKDVKAAEKAAGKAQAEAAKLEAASLEALEAEAAKVEEEVLELPVEAASPKEASGLSQFLNRR